MLHTMFSVVSMISLVGASTAYARPPGGGPGFRPEMIERVAGELGVTDAVLVKIQDRVYESEKEKIGLKSELEGAHLELRRMMDRGEPNIDQVLRQVDKVGTLETRIKKNRVRLMLTVRAMLTPAQRDKLQTIMQEHRRERRGRRDRRWGGREQRPAPEGFGGAEGDH